MSNLQKYMRAKKETVNCISESFLEGEEQSMNAEGKVKRQITPFTRGRCALHVHVRSKGVKFCVCVLLNLCSHTVCSMFAVSSGCHEMLPWRQCWHVDKIVNTNPEEKALFHQHKITATISAAGSVCFFNSQIPHVLEKNTELLPAYLLEAAQERFEACFMTLSPMELVHKPNTNFYRQTCCQRTMVVVLVCTPWQLSTHAHFTVKCILFVELVAILLQGFLVCFMWKTWQYKSA